MTAFQLRRTLATAVALGAVTATALPALAVSVTVNGQSVTFSPAPIERAGRVFVPLRGVFERLGASVVYQAGVINANGNGRAISLKIGSTQATVDGQTKVVDVAPFIIGASTYVPLRFVSEALGAGVNYDAAHQIVALTTSGQPAAAAAAAPAATPITSILKALEPASKGFVQSTKPTVSAGFVQAVDPNSVHLQLDGLDITTAATRSSSGFVYSPPSPLQSMQHTLQVTGKTATGTAFSEAWTFTSGSAAPSNTLSLTSPAPGVTTVGQTFAVSGRTAPNAKVHIVAGAAASIGGFALAAGNYTGDTIADASGNFSLSVTLQTVPGASIGLTVTSTDPKTEESAYKKLLLHAK